MKNKLKIFSFTFICSTLFLSSCNKYDGAFSKITDDSSTTILDDGDYNKLLAPTNISFDDETLTLTWEKVNGARSYELNVNGKTIDDNIKIDSDYAVGFYEFEEGQLNLNEVLVFSVRAKSGTSRSNFYSYVFDINTTESTFAFLTSTNEDNTITILGLNPKANYVIEDEFTIPSKVGGKIVTEIGVNAFKSIRGYSSLILPTTIKKIGAGAFYDTAASTVNFLECVNLVEIDDGAFEKASRINEFNVPSSLKKIGDNAFAKASSLKKLSFNYDENNQTSYSSLEYIGSYAFTSTKLDTIKLPKSLTEIASFAFTDCKIKSIDFENNSTITTIGEEAFSKCSDLVSLTIPSSLLTLGNKAFNLCKKLSYIYIDENANLQVIGDGAFADCSVIKYFGNYIEEIPEGYKLSIMISKNVVSIGNEAFSKLQCHSINFTSNSSLLSIGSQAFFSNSLIKEVNIPDSVNYIYEDAFRDCKNLQTINFSNNSNIIFIDNSAFANTKYVNNLKNQEIIFGNVLYAASKDMLESQTITLDDTLVSISNDVFIEAKCENVVIPKSIVSIGDNAFKNCSNLTSITFEEDSELLSIGNNVFENNFNLTNIQLPLKLQSIGNKAFIDCNKLTSVTFDANSELLSIGDNAFENTSSLSTLLLPFKLESIGSYAFSNSNISSITLSSNLKEIKDYAFNDCSQLTSITLPSSLTYLGKGVFNNNSLLNSVVFEDNCISTSKTIYSDTFASCISLKSINLPDYIEYIDENAFANCSSLTSFVCNSSSLQINNNAFINSKIENDSINGLFVINDTLIKYIGNDEIVTLPNGIKTISSDAFSNSNIKEINISSSVEVIEDNAFANCSNLVNVSTSNNSSLNYIGKNAFINCINLETFILPDSIQSIDEYAFYYCISLKNIDLNKPLLTNIAPYSFAACNLLDNVTFNDNLKEIGEYAFYKCSLKNINLPAALTKIDSHAFAYNGLADNRYLDPSNWNIIPSILTINFNDNLTYIGEYAFADTNISSIDLNVNKTIRLREFCFKNASNLTIFIAGEDFILEQGVINGANKISYIEIPTTISVRGLFGGYSSMVPISLKEVNVIGDGNTIFESSYSGLTYVEKITLPTTITTIENNAFYGNSRLHTIVNLDNVTYIGKNAFVGCTLLDFDVSNTFTNVTYIGDRAFNATKFMNSSDDEFIIINDILIKYNGNDKTVNVPENVIMIAGGAFAANDTANKIVLPEATKNICAGAFDGCYSLDILELTSSTFVSIELNTFAYTSSSLDIKVKKDLVDDYQSNTYWSLLAEQIKGM